MSTSHTTPTRSRKFKAILAGGLVLGVGAAITLAAWTDQEFATGDFGTGTFGIEGSIDGGTTFAEHPAAGSAASLDFQVDADALTPGDVVYAPFAVQSITGTTEAATVTFDSAPAGVLAPSLTAGAALVTAGTVCDDTLTYDASTFDLATATTPQHLCLQVALADDQAVPQGAAGTVTWTFSAVTN